MYDNPHFTNLVPAVNGGAENGAELEVTLEDGSYSVEQDLHLL